VPTLAALGPNAPNPFAAVTRIGFDVPTPGQGVRIAVYDVRGALVRVLKEGWTAAGRGEVVWDGRRADGTPARSGLYLCRMTVGTKLVGLRRLTVLR
jgi:flagellar hook assembly protein FlgD